MPVVCSHVAWQGWSLTYRADGYLVVFHDETLQRLCGIQSRVDQLTLSEIQRHLQLGHQIITLDMLTQTTSLPSPPSSQGLPPFDKNAPHPLDSLYGISRAPKVLTPKPQRSTISDPPLTKFTHIELEIKTHDRTDYPNLIRALTHYLIDTPLASLPIVLTTFDVQLLAQLQRSKPLSRIPRGLLVRTPELLASAPNTALQLGCTRLGMYYPLITQSIIQTAHRYGLPVSAWTVNDIEIAKKLVQWQVDVIVTDIPTQFL